LSYLVSNLKKWDQMIKKRRSHRIVYKLTFSEHEFHFHYMRGKNKQKI
jgi:hypothetical protein